MDAQRVEALPLEMTSVSSESGGKSRRSRKSVANYGSALQRVEGLVHSTLIPQLWLIGTQIGSRSAGSMGVQDACSNASNLRMYSFVPASLGPFEAYGTLLKHFPAEESSASEASLQPGTIAAGLRSCWRLRTARPLIIGLDCLQGKLVAFSMSLDSSAKFRIHAELPALGLLSSDIVDGRHVGRLILVTPCRTHLLVLRFSLSQAKILRSADSRGPLACAKARRQSAQYKPRLMLSPSASTVLTLPSARPSLPLSPINP